MVYLLHYFSLQLAPFDFRQQIENLGRRLGRVGGLHSLGAEQSPGQAIRGKRGGKRGTNATGVTMPRVLFSDRQANVASSQAFRLTDSQRAS